MTKEKEVELRTEMAKLYSQAKISPELVKKAIDDAIDAIKQREKDLIPTPAIYDRYGQLLAINARVAFNCSGEVRLGYIKLVKGLRKGGRTARPNGDPYVEIHVVQDDGAKLSKVTNRANLVVV